MANSTSFHKGEVVSIVLTLLVALLLAFHVQHGHQEDIVLAQKILGLNQRVLALEKSAGKPAK